MGADYAVHARYWDWDGLEDHTADAFWQRMAGRYGTRVLSPMCAIGQTAAYMAKCGMQVTALDAEPAMIAEGMRRFGQVPELRFCCGDVCAFELDKTFDYCFFASMDIHLLPDLQAVKQALRCVNRHLRQGGGLGMEVWFAPAASFSSPMRRFEPRAPRKDGLYIWKEGDGHYDASARVHRIRQVVHIGEKEQFEHSVTLQLYTREALVAALCECGFALKDAWCDTAGNKSADEQKNVYLELVRTEASE